MNTDKFYNILYSLNPSFPGQIILLPKGLVLLNKLKSIIRNLYLKNNSKEISSPTIGSDALWNKTKHTDKYIENMYKIDDSYYLKPMNCPMHVEIMKTLYDQQSILPISVFEFNYCYRKEKSGSINSLFRLLRFTQDDCHTIVKLEDAKSVLVNFIGQVVDLYKNLGVPNLKFRLSNTDESFIGNEDDSQKASQIIQSALEDVNVRYTTSKDGAFYGPKIDIIVLDGKGKEWQTGTMQVDFYILGNLEFVFKNNDKNIKYILFHQAMLGTFERFIGILLDNNIMPSCINPFRRSIVVIDNNAYYETLKRQSINIQDIDIYHTNKNSINHFIKKSYALGYEELCIIGNREIDNSFALLQNTKTKNNKEINLNKLFE